MGAPYYIRLIRPIDPYHLRLVGRIGPSSSDHRAIYGVASAERLGFGSVTDTPDAAEVRKGVRHPNVEAGLCHRPRLSPQRCDNWGGGGYLPG